MTRTAADNILNNVAIPKIDAAQPPKLTANGRYYQCVRSHTNVPTTASTPPDRLGVKTTDKAECWNELGASGMPANWPCTITLNVYQSPSGHGYDIVAQVNESGTPYIKTVSRGPEAAQRTHDWVIVTP